MLNCVWLQVYLASAAFEVATCQDPANGAAKARRIYEEADAYMRDNSMSRVFSSHNGSRCTRLTHMLQG